jgi:hypothetical protein
MLQLAMTQGRFWKMQYSLCTTPEGYSERMAQRVETVKKLAVSGNWGVDREDEGEYVKDSIETICRVCMNHKRKGKAKA